jgi:hypothetical protein
VCINACPGGLVVTTEIQPTRTEKQLPRRKKVVLNISIEAIDMMTKVCKQRGWYGRGALVETALREWFKKHDGEV